MNYSKRISILTFLFVILTGGLLSTCGRIQAGQGQGEGEITVDLAVEPAEPAVGPAQLVVTVTDAAGQPINSATLDIEGNMTHAGMVPVFAQASGGENGRYSVPFEWTMGGDWSVTIEVTLENGQTISREFPVTVQ